MIAVSNTATLVTIFVLASGGSEGYLSWALFVSLIIAGAITALHAAKLGRIAPGYILLMGPRRSLHGRMRVGYHARRVRADVEPRCPRISRPVRPRVLARTIATRHHSRRIGVAFMLISASVMPIAIARLEDVPAEASPLAGLAVGAAALIAAMILMLRASGILRLFAIPLTIAAGWVVAVPLGVFDFRSALDAPVVWSASILCLARLQLYTPGRLPRPSSRLLIVSVVVGIKASNEGAAIQQVSWRGPRAVDFRGVQGTLNVSGVGVLLAGIVGTLPPPQLPALLHRAHKLHLRSRTPRRVCHGCHAHRPRTPAKIVAVLLTIPRPVTGVILMIVMGLLFVEGIRTVLQDGISQQKAIIVGLALSIGIGLQTHNILADPLGNTWGVAVGNSVVVGILAAVLMEMVLEITASQTQEVRD